MQKIRVLIVDDQQLVRKDWRPPHSHESVEVVGTAPNGGECLAMVSRLQPEVILMDIRMPIMDGITAVELLRERGSTARVLMLTTFDDEEYIVKSLRAGAEGYLMKDVPVDNLAMAIVQVYNGTFQIAPGVMGTLLREQDERIKNDPDVRRMWEGFSDRERDILQLLGQGATNREIAEHIHLSEGTVKNYVSDILTSLDLRDRTQAALLSVRNGWDRR